MEVLHYRKSNLYIFFYYKENTQSLYSQTHAHIILSGLHSLNRGGGGGSNETANTSENGNKYHSNVSWNVWLQEEIKGGQERNG